MHTSPSILVIAPFFGPWPKWMPLFLESCRLNADITWLLLGKVSLPWEVPSNVHSEKMGLYEILKRAQVATGFDVQKENYSQCDLRPLYGKIFADYLHGYDFWGHCDVDILWGRLREFFTDQILEKYSIISTKRNTVGGPFVLYRNTPQINDFFLEVPGCQKKLEFPMWVSFDETLLTRHIQKLMKKNHLPFPVFWKNNWAVDCAKRRTLSSSWIWKQGRIQDAQAKEYMALHFGTWKHTFRFIESNVARHAFHVTRFGIFSDPLPQLHYLKWYLEEFCTLSFWRWRLADVCRKVLRGICRSL
ncbi:MAG: hypothetical protein C5B47_07010 [Verrucomicrobia bacterium]|nr:MAG: hypothetical protein C5B47_07010 [Verrucomicrobiota bacterium]